MLRRHVVVFTCCQWVFLIDLGVPCLHVCCVVLCVCVCACACVCVVRVCARVCGACVLRARAWSVWWTQFLLTHDHADAVLGLDDIRDIGTHAFWAENCVRKATPGRALLRTATMPIHVMDTHMEIIRQKFPYLFPRAVPEPSLVPDIQWCPFTATTPTITVHDLDVDVLPVWHGANYLCSGFALGHAPHRLVYLSDVSEVPAPVLARLQAEPIALLILDCCSPGQVSVHSTHFNLDKALDFIRMVSYL